MHKPGLISMAGVRDHCILQEDGQVGFPNLMTSSPKARAFFFFYIAYPAAPNRVFSLHREHHVIITAVGVTTKSALQCGEAMRQGQLQHQLGKTLLRLVLISGFAFDFFFFPVIVVTQ